MPPTLSPEVKAKFEGVITNFNDPDQTNLLATLKKQNPTEATQIEAAHAAYKSCFTTTPDKAKCLAQIASGTQPTPPGSGAAVKNITHHGTQREILARNIAQDFFNSLKTKGVKLIGDPKIDKKIIEEEWAAYRQKNTSKEGIDDANKVIVDWFSLGSFWSTTRLFALGATITRGAGKYVITPIGFVFAAAAFGVDVLSLFNVEIKSDNDALQFVANDFLGFLSLGHVKIDLKGTSRDIGGVMNITDTTFGLTGQILSNPFLDGWLKSLPNEDRPLAQNVLMTLTLVGLLKANLLQENLLQISWSEQYMPDVRTMVEQLMRYLFAHGDMTKVSQAHRFMPEINGQSSGTIDVISVITRGALAGLIGWNAANNAKLYARGSRGMAVLERAKENRHNDSLKSTDFQDTARSLNANDQRAGFAMLMTDSLVLADIIMESLQDLYNSQGWSNDILRGLTPVAAAALTVAGLGLLTALVTDDVTGGDALASYIDKYKQNTTVEELEANINTKGILTDTPSTDIFLAIFFGGLEAVAAGYSKNRRAVVDSFALVNNMIATNLVFSHAAHNTSITFENSGQGPGDPNSSLTEAMVNASRLQFFSSFFAGLDAGGTAYLMEGPLYFIEWLPLAAGLAIRGAYLYEASSQLPAGPARDKVVDDEWWNFGAFAGAAVISYGVSWLLEQKFDLSFKFENGQYMVDGQVGPAPGGLVVKGSFGPTAPSPKTRQKELLAEMNHDQKILEDLKTELDTINAQIAAVPNSLTVEQKNAMATRERSIIKSLLALNTSMAKNGAELTREQISDIDQGLRTGLIAFNPADPMQRKLVTGELLPGLIAKRKFLANQIAALGSKAPLPLLPGQRSTSIFRNPVLPSYTPEEQALVDNYGKALDIVEAQIKKLESGSSADLIALYQENTGVNLVLQGFNPVLQNYKQRLEIQHRQLAMTAKLYEMMLPG